MIPSLSQSRENTLPDTVQAFDARSRLRCRLEGAPSGGAALKGVGRDRRCEGQELDSTFVLKLLLWSAGGGALVKYGSVAAGLPAFQPTLPLALGLVSASTAAGLYTAYVATEHNAARRVGVGAPDAF